MLLQNGEYRVCSQATFLGSSLGTGLYQLGDPGQVTQLSCALVSISLKWGEVANLIELSRLNETNVQDVLTYICI